MRVVLSGSWSARATRATGTRCRGCQRAHPPQRVDSRPPGGRHGEAVRSSRPAPDRSTRAETPRGACALTSVRLADFDKARARSVAATSTRPMRESVVAQPMDAPRRLVYMSPVSCPAADRFARAAGRSETGLSNRVGHARALTQRSMNRRGGSGDAPRGETQHRSECALQLDDAGAAGAGERARLPRRGRLARNRAARVAHTREARPDLLRRARDDTAGTRGTRPPRPSPRQERTRRDRAGAAGSRTSARSTPWSIARHTRTGRRRWHRGPGRRATVA